MKNFVFLCLFFHISSSFSMNTDQVNKYKELFLKRLLGVEAQYEYTLRQLRAVTDREKTPDLEVHERVGLIMSNHHSLKLCKDKWDAITVEMVESYLFDDDELGRALVDYKSQVFNL